MSGARAVAVALTRRPDVPPTEVSEGKVTQIGVTKDGYPAVMVTLGRSDGQNPVAVRYDNSYVPTVGDKLQLVETGGDIWVVSLLRPNTTEHRFAAAAVAGDLFYATASGRIARLPRGSEGQVLKTIGTAPAWRAPEVDSGWIAPTLLNGWTNYGSGFASAGYRKINKTVYVRGGVKGGAAGSKIFDIPVGYRFAGFQDYYIASVTDTGFGYVKAKGIGDASLNHFAGGTAYVELHTSWAVDE